MHHSPSRRSFLQAAAALTLAPRLTSAQQAAPRFPGMIVRQYEPENLEMPFATLDRFITPTERFFVRSHFPVPALDAASWRLRVEGAVARPLELRLDELRQMESASGTALLECAGNSRVFLTPRQPGLLWELGAVGTAEWVGVPLAAILERAGVQPGAVEVILEGADSGEIREPAPFQTPGRVAYARSVPLAKARQDVLLAHRMNGADLTAAHGYPLRAIVPGWYGMASVKWLSKIIVTDRPFQGFFQSFEYTYFERQAGLPTLTPVTELQVKALIARPARLEIVAAGSAYRVHGAAWTGGSEIAQVEVSTDGGAHWAAARLLDTPIANAWRLWEYQWQVPDRRGRHTLMARATDRRGRTQPSRPDPDRRNTMINFTLPIPIEVQ